jgi:hypothetical protein
VWQGARRTDPTDVLYSYVDLATPPRETTVAMGRLTYVGRQPGCGTDAYRLVDCDGRERQLVQPRFPGVEVFLGNYVAVRGELVDDGTCPRIEAREIWYESSPCPRSSGSVTGVLRSSGRPVEGAQVAVDGVTASTGPSGRFFADEVKAGTRVVTATAACALTAQLDDAVVPSGYNLIVPDGGLVRADVVQDCVIDLHDLMRVAQRYKSRPPFRPPCVDLDLDATVSVFDLAMVAANYGRSCPTRWAEELDSRTPRTGNSARVLPERGNGDLGGRGAGEGADDEAAGGHDGGRRGLAAAADAAASGADRGEDTLWRASLRDAAGVRGWSLEVGYEGTLRDRDAARDGTQPFDPRPLPAGAFVAENAAADGIASLAVVMPAPAAPIDGAAVLGEVRLASSSPPRLLSAVLAADDGRRAGGLVTLTRVSDAASRRIGDAWLPAVWRALRPGRR